jgi:hypothetical protein
LASSGKPFQIEINLSQISVSETENISVKPDFQANVLLFSELKENCEYEIVTHSGQFLQKGIIQENRIVLPKIDEKQIFR